MGIAALVLLVLGTLAALGTHSYLRITGERDLRAITARLDAEQPGWRLPELLATRNAKLPPPGENSAELVQTAIAVYPSNPSAPEPVWQTRGAINQRPRSTEVAAVTTALQPFEPALRIARTLHTQPRGGLPLSSPDIPTRTIKHGEQIATIAELLRCEAELAALDGRAETAAGRTLAVLNVARSIGDEPLFLSQWDRLRIGFLATRTLCQVLAWSELPEASLARLQSELDAEAREPLVHWAIRGERAVFCEALDKVRAGQVDSRGMPVGGPLSTTPENYGFIWGGTRGSAPENHVLQWYRRAGLASDQAKFLEFMTRLDRLCDLPPHERLAALDAVVSDLSPFQLASGLTAVRYTTTSLYPPFMGAFIRIEIHYRANLICAVVGIACERFRLKRGRWPESLAELCPGFLTAVPLDPFDGHAIRFTKLPDGVVVRSAGPRPKPHRPQVVRPGLPDGIEIGFRLWNPEARRQPPRPEPKKP